MIITLIPKFEKGLTMKKRLVINDAPRNEVSVLEALNNCVPFECDLDIEYLAWEISQFDTFRQIARVNRKWVDVIEFKNYTLKPLSFGAREIRTKYPYFVVMAFSDTFSLYAVE